MIHHGDLFDVLPTLDAESIDACITDPPYGIGFMGKEWDSFKPGEEAKRIVVNHAIESDNPNLRGRTRAPASSPSAVEYNRSLHGQREFQAWTERWAREVYRVLKPGAHLLVCGAPRSFHRMTCGLEDAGFEIRDCLTWLYGQGFPKSLNLGDGRGTALKPGWEPIIVARKPLAGTVAANVLAHGTGALNIDACRIETNGETWERQPESVQPSDSIGTFKTGVRSVVQHDLGRWPANVVLDEEAARILDEQTGDLHSAGFEQGGGDSRNGRSSMFGIGNQTSDQIRHGDTGGASRFFYVAKPSREERDYGCKANRHPTVKPITLMRWLVKLITPQSGTVLDPFLGSGTTGMACRYEHREFIGIEREAEYVAIAERRIQAVAPLFGEAG